MGRFIDLTKMIPSPSWIMGPLEGLQQRPLGEIIFSGRGRALPESIASGGHQWGLRVSAAGALWLFLTSCSLYQPLLSRCLAQSRECLFHIIVIGINQQVCSLPNPVPNCV